MDPRLSQKNRTILVGFQKKPPVIKSAWIAVHRRGHAAMDNITNATSVALVWIINGITIIPHRAMHQKFAQAQ